MRKTASVKRQLCANHKMNEKKGSIMKNTGLHSFFRSRSARILYRTDLERCSKCQRSKCINRQNPGRDSVNRITLCIFEF